MPAILCLETSAAVCSVAVIQNDLIQSETSVKIQAHAEVLSDLIKTCLEKTGISFNELSAVAISEGPGSYTGLRIGTSTAKGICFGLEIPLIPLNTLKIIASAVIEQTPSETIWPMIDARRMEVYHCVFDRSLRALTEVKSGIITDRDFTPSIINKETVLCGDGAGKAAGILQLPYLNVHAHAEAMCQMAVKAYTAGEFADLASFEPFYLKQANITGSAAKSQD